MVPAGWFSESVSAVVELRSAGESLLHGIVAMAAKWGLEKIIELETDPSEGSTKSILEMSSDVAAEDGCVMVNTRNFPPSEKSIPRG